MKGMIQLKNLSYYPFERNKYFYGKLLTVADFELEQKYMNNKRRFLNRTILGYGVTCGLNTYNVDDTSIMIEAGAAIDGTGREIVVPESIIRKLSTIEGYDAITGNTAYLCIEYDEVLSDPVYSVASQDTSKGASEFNRVKEGYRLFLTNKEPKPAPYSLIEDFISKKVIFSNKDVTVVQSVPRVVSGLLPFNIQVDIIKHTTISNFSFEYVIDTPYFDTKDGSNKIHVKYDDLSAGSPRKETLIFTLIPPHSIQTEATLSIETNSMKFSAQNDLIHNSDNIVFNISVVQEDIFEMIEKKYFSISLESPSMSNSNTPIYLAKIQIFRSSNAYIIESVKPMPFRQYVYNPQLLNLQKRLEGFFPGLAAYTSEPANSALDKAQRQNSSLPSAPEIISASGVIEIPLGFNPRPKQKFYSKEIMHGLGKGSVSIVLGLEASAASERLVRGDFTCYGNPEVFKDSDYNTYLPDCEISALCFEERGTFVVGVKLLETTTTLSLKVRWHAFKQPVPPAARKREDSYLFIKPDTIVVAPRETVYFKAIFYNTDETPCNWYVVEEGGGVIEPNGMYTAPNKEGVYEINVESVSDPSLRASAFVVVKEKGDHE